LLEFINQPVNVEVRVQSDGSIQPLAFLYHGRRFQIENWGRDTEETLAGRDLHCYLVQSPGPETWELCQDKKTAQWTLRRHWADTSRAV
jgi:hypothetical protein